ncbi:hypothetical protein IIA79_01750 [bacterium]|nr:hypothetical protein [bacterium]
MNHSVDLQELARTPVAEASFTVLDLETTGGAPPDHKITEIAAYRIDGLEVTDEYQTLVNPERSLPSFITKLTGISAKMLLDKPPSRDVLPGLLEFVGDTVLVAHHSDFDRKFLDNELELAGLEPLGNTDLCTCRLARRILPWLPSKGLGGLAAFFGVEIVSRHRAAADALAASRLLLIFLDYLEERGLATLEEVLLFQYGELEYKR